MRFAKAILAFASASLLLASALGDSLTETRCWCATEDHVGLINAINLTSTQYNRDYNYYSWLTNRRQDETTKNTLGVRCDNGTCHNIPKVEKYKILLGNMFNRDPKYGNCQEFDDGRKVCTTADSVYVDNKRYNFRYKNKQLQEETITDCAEMCKTKWRQDETAYDLCTYENRNKGEHYGKLVPSGQKMGKHGKLKGREDDDYALYSFVGCGRDHIPELKLEY